MVRASATSTVPASRRSTGRGSSGPGGGQRLPGMEVGSGRVSRQAAHEVVEVRHDHQNRAHG
jgi:hypothetical protein